MTKRMLNQLVRSTAVNGATVVSLYDFLSRLIFQASVATLFNEEAGNDKDLYAAFLDFDKQLPIAAAGVSVSHLGGAAKRGRGKLLAAVAKYTTDNSEFIARRREHFDEIGLTAADSASYQLAILWASVGNTMPATFWLLFHLLSDRALLAQATKEVSEAFLASGSADHLSAEQLNGMVFLDACITEALRLSSGSLLMRFVRRSCDLTLSSGNTYRFRKGDRVGLCPALNHFDEEIFPRAAAFDPHRWLRGETAEERVAGSCGRIPLFKGGKEIPK